MKNRFRIGPYLLYLVIPFVYLLMQVFTGLNEQESFIIAFQIFITIRLIDNIGRTICFYDFLVFYSVLTTLTVSILGYRVFNETNPLAQLWQAYMRVPESEYYGFMIPANMALFLGVNLLTPFINRLPIRDLIQSLEVHMKNKGKIGIGLMVIGFVFTFVSGFSLGPLTYVAYLFSMLKYVGPLYLYFSDFRQKNLIVILSLLLFLFQSIYIGLFGEFALYTSLMFFIISLRFKLRFITKFSVVIGGLFLVMILQSVKPVYREITWRGKNVEGLSTSTHSPTEIFFTLFVDRLTDFSKVTEDLVLFNIYRRMNQGFLIAWEMDYIPRVQPFAKGETIWRSLAAVVVPRFLWPDKPEAGGRDNIKRFLGLKRITFSMNVGPYGEGYGNFDVNGGIAFVFAYGLLLSALLFGIIRRCFKTKTLIVWLPLLFFYTLTVETDILTTINSLVKTLVFIGLLYLFSSKFLKISL